MLRLTEVASQSVTFVKPALSKAKTNTLNSLNDWLAHTGHYPVVFSLDRPPLLAVRRVSPINDCATPIRLFCCCPTQDDIAPFHIPTTRKRYVRRTDKLP